MLIQKPTFLSYYNVFCILLSSLPEMNIFLFWNLALRLELRSASESVQGRPGGSN